MSKSSKRRSRKRKRGPSSNKHDDEGQGVGGPLFGNTSREGKKPLQQQQQQQRQQQPDEDACTTASRKKKRKKRSRKATSGDKSRPLKSTTAKGIHSRQQPRQHPTVRKNRPPSEEALALSASLKELSGRKKLREALRLYWDESNDDVRDGHHGSIVVDCCARCGAVEEAEKVINNMQKTGTHVPIQANTALLKGYAHSGQMHKGAALYNALCMSKDKTDRPNIRTFNTLLRGCLWTAASVSPNETNSTVAHPDKRNAGCNVAGGVITSEEAWSMSSSRATSPSKNPGRQGPCIDLDFDLSSYEYSVTLLCQALRCEEAEDRIAEMKRVFDVQTTSSKDSGDIFAGADRDTRESLAVSLLALSRAYALLGRSSDARGSARSALNAIMAASNCGGADSLTAGTKITERVKIKSCASGGKRASRNTAGKEEQDCESSTSRRAASNLIFRNHRLSELKYEANSILRTCSGSSSKSILTNPKILASFLITRLLYFSGGGTTSLSATGGKNRKKAMGSEWEVQKAQLIDSLWLSFGLPAAIGMPSGGRPCSFIEKGGSTMSKEENSVLRDLTGNIGDGILSDDGFINFSAVFDPIVVENGIGQTNESDSARKHNPCRPLHIELGAGSGDWIVSQARANPSRDYVAVELRADRLWRTFSKCMLSASNDERSFRPLENVSCVGAECGSFLRDRVRNGTVSTIYVNHPEPPTQTYGADDENLSALLNGDEEPAHMLNSETLISAVQCLEGGGEGKLIIVTDNRWYARLLCRTLQKVMQTNPLLLRQLDLDRAVDMRRIETFTSLNGDVCSRGGDRNGLVLYEGQPCEAIGHSFHRTADGDEKGTSYFDRLWRTGAGSHAEMRKRFIIAVRTFDKDKDKDGGNSYEKSLEKQAKHTKKSKKKNAAKQKRRNERRLLAKMKH